MTLQQIKYFIAVANSGSISNAAKSLFISQPSLSEALKSLENETGLTLMVRTNRGVTLTPDGLEFLGYARQITEQYKLAEDHFIKKKTSKIKFSVSMQHYSFAVKAFVETVKYFGMDKYAFAVYETQTHEVIENVKNWRSEIGILYLSDFNEKVIRKLLKGSQLEFHPLFPCSIYAYLWCGHPLAGRDEISIDDLEEYPCLSFDQGSNNSFYFAEEVMSTYDYKRTIKVNDRATMLNLMKGLNGYTLCSGIICTELNGPEYKAVKLETDGVMNIGYITREHTSLSQIGKHYLEELMKFQDEVL
jgi:DNA-binding transcriptional LysR family regulator